MKSSLHPAVAACIIILAVGGIVFFLWRGSQGINRGGGRLQSDLNFDAVSKKAQQDPEQFRKELEASIKRGQAGKGE
jgi:hypothetical protein